MSVDQKNAPALLRAWDARSIDQDTQGAKKALHMAADVIEALTAMLDFAAGKVEDLEDRMAGARDAAYAAGFEACREMAVAAAEEYELSAPTYDIQRAESATAGLISSDIRALQPQKKEVSDE